MIIACLLLNFCIKNCENRLLNKVFMIGCMTCPWAPMAGETTAQSGQRNDGVTTSNTQQSLHHRLGHINRTLHTDKADDEPEGQSGEVVSCRTILSYGILRDCVRGNYVLPKIGWMCLRLSCPEDFIRGSCPRWFHYWSFFQFITWCHFKWHNNN